MGKINTPESRAKSAERLRAQKANPEFEAKRLAAIKAAAERGVFKKQNTENNKKAWGDPTKRAIRLRAIRESYDDEKREAARQRWAKLRADPVFEAKRLAALAKVQERNTLRLTAMAIATHRKRRGFDIPHHLKAEYVFLRKRKHLSAREAGLVLGLVRP